MEEPVMRVMVIVKANKESESGVLPSREILTEMGKFNEELVKAGVMLAGEGLHSSAKGVRVKFGGGKSAVTDGPFTDRKSTRLNSSHLVISYAVFCLKKKKNRDNRPLVCAGVQPVVRVTQHA